MTKSFAPQISLSRRGFLAGTAGLTFSFSVPALAGSASAATADAPFAPNFWLTIDRSGAITIMSPAAELGQGSFTSLPVILAEELDADWAHVKIVQSPMDGAKYGNPFYNYALGLITTSSVTVRAYYKPLRIAGAQARRVLLDAVADRWHVSVDELTTEPSFVVHAGLHRRMSYGQIASFAKAPAQLPAIDEKDLKPRSKFRLIGSDLPRVEVPLKVRGAAKYAMDVRLPGMIYAAILQSPYEGGAPVTVDDSKAYAVPGVQDVIKLPQGVAVLGATVEGTQAAKNLLKVTWSDAEGASYDSEKALDTFAAAARDKSKHGADFFNAGDVDTAVKDAHSVMTAEYRTRHLCHAQMEPLNATAIVAPDGKSAEVWMGTQSPTLFIGSVARLLNIAPAQVTLHQHWVGGAYGRRGHPDVGLDAVMVAKAAPGKPVKVIWSREDDMKAGKFRPATAQFIEAGFDADSRIISWHHRVAAESPVAFMFGEAGLQRLQGKDNIVMKGAVLGHYGIPNRRAEYVRQAGGARLSPWRGVGVGHNLLAIEGFIDEIAHAQKKDPLEFRLSMTRNASPRATKVLETVAEMANWGKKRTGTALGLAMEEKDDTLVAGIAEISFDSSSAKIKVHNFWAAIDCGTAVQPRNTAYLTEGGIIYGLGSALREQIVIKDGRVQQSNFTDYEVMRMEDVPNVSVHVMTNDYPPTGVGEDGVPLAGASVGNAFFALTGVRLRELPMSPANIRQAIGGKA
jgi:isoquinoline 1-oxidoreductase subunit beta